MLISRKEYDKVVPLKGEDLKTWEKMKKSWSVAGVTIEPKSQEEKALVEKLFGSAVMKKSFDVAGAQRVAGKVAQEFLSGVKTSGVRMDKVAYVSMLAANLYVKAETQNEDTMAQVMELAEQVAAEANKDMVRLTAIDEVDVVESYNGGKMAMKDIVVSTKGNKTSLLGQLHLIVELSVNDIAPLIEELKSLGYEIRK